MQKSTLIQYNGDDKYLSCAKPPPQSKYYDKRTIMIRMQTIYNNKSLKQLLSVNCFTIGILSGNSV